MQLAKYLNDNDLSLVDFAELVDVDQSHLSRIIRGERQPSPKLMGRILQATNKKVKPNDFLPEAFGKDRVEYQGSKSRIE